MGCDGVKYKYIIKYETFKMDNYKYAIIKKKFKYKWNTNTKTSNKIQMQNLVYLQILIANTPKYKYSIIIILNC